MGCNYIFGMMLTEHFVCYRFLDVFNHFDLRCQEIFGLNQFLQFFYVGQEVTWMLAEFLAGLVD